MKRSLLIIICLSLSIFAWGTNFPTKPTKKQKDLRIEEQLSSYLYSLADTLTYELQDKYHADYSYTGTKIESVLVKELIDNNWSEIENYQYQYDEDRITEEVYQIYDNGWLNYQRESYTYNEDNLLITYQQDNWLNNAWEAYLLIDYIYDAEGVLINEEWTYYTTSREIDTAYDVTYQYDQEGMVEGETWTYSIDNINWINYLKGIYQRNDDYVIVHEDWQYWSDNVWISYLQYTHTYNDFLLIGYTEGLTFLDNQWQYYDNYSYTYNTNQNTVDIIGKLWSTDANNWVNSYKYHYEYQEVITSNQNVEIANDLNVSVFPNPIINEIKFASKNQLKKVSVYNLKGQRIYSSFLNDKQGTLLNLNNYPNGIYFFKFEDDKGNVAVTKKLKIKN